MLKDTTIVFDLDGTLVDTAPDLTNALNAVLTQRGHAPVPREIIRATVGRGAKIMIEEALRLAGLEGDVDEMLADFLVYYEANIAVESRPFPGTVEALEGLSSLGTTLAVCTNKLENLSRELLQALELDGYFTTVAGRDTFGVAKPDPRHLTGTIALAGGNPSAALMIGDSDIDFRTARAASVPVLLVRFGYGPLPTGGLAPDIILDHFAELEGRAAALLQRHTEGAAARS
jgi:phosphoglycolate phosphatase